MTAEKKSGKELITKEMAIGDLIQKYPESREVLLGFGLHCLYN